MSDMIDRQAVLSVIDRLSFVQYLECGEYVGEEVRLVTLILAGSMISAIKSIPSADPDTDTVARDIATIIENEKDMRVILQNADRTATWVPEPDRRNHWHCSKCGYVIGILKVDARYCLNCGCQMREGDNA